MPESHRDLYVTVGDGLRLYARDSGPLVGDALPVVCLAGLTRNSTDFDDLAQALAQDPHRPRRVIALDYRGRGRSDRDPDPGRYQVQVELDDTLQVLTAAGIAEAVVVGTSRGGLIAMGMGAARPALLRGVVLNDIGPVVEIAGIARIRGYVGKMPQPRSVEEAVGTLKRIMGAQFPRFTEEDWRALARGTWTESDGQLVPAYDPQLMRGLAELDLEAPLPVLWPLFEGLKRVPVLALRGANSDLLSAETLEAMAAAHPDLEAVTVPDQGHAPVLSGANLIGRIKAFVDRCEARDGTGS